MRCRRRVVARVGLLGQNSDTSAQRASASSVLRAQPRAAHRQVARHRRDVQDVRSHAAPGPEHRRRGAPRRRRAGAGFVKAHAELARRRGQDRGDRSRDAVVAKRPAASPAHQPRLARRHALAPRQTIEQHALADVVLPGLARPMLRCASRPNSSSIAPARTAGRRSSPARAWWPRARGRAFRTPPSATALKFAAANTDSVSARRTTAQRDCLEGAMSELATSIG